ncbi:hypothetical protein ACFL0R_03390 [Pseudomonadota bacterium]
MSNSILKLLAVMAMFVMAVSSVSAEHKYTTVIFPFAEKGDHIEDFGKRISNELSANLFDSPDVTLVNQDDLQRQLDEAMLEISEMVNLTQANEIGRITGTQIVITGTIMESGDSIIIVSRVISTKTSREFIETIRGRKDDAESLMDTMVDRMADVIKYHAFKLAS